MTIKRKIIAILTTISFVLLLVGSQNVFAQEPEIDYSNYIKVINNNTQEQVDIDIKHVITTTSPVKSARSTFSTSDDFVKEVEIRFDIAELEGIKPRISSDASTNNGNFVAYLRIDYEKSGTTSSPKIKITSVQGSWKCTSTSYSARFENKEVIVRQGSWVYNGALVKNPSDNAFYYSTGWGYVDDVPKTDYSGVWAFSSAKAIINGMGGGYTIETQVSK